MKVGAVLPSATNGQASPASKPVRAAGVDLLLRQRAAKPLLFAAALLPLAWLVCGIFTETPVANRPKR